MNKQFLRFSIFTAFFIILIVTLVVRLQTYFHLGFFLAVFMSSTSLYWQLKCNWYFSEKLFLSCAFEDVPFMMLSWPQRKHFPVADKKQPRAVFLFWESSWAEESELLSVVKAEIALLKHTDRNSPLSCSPLHWKVSSLPQLPTESVIIF